MPEIAPDLSDQSRCISVHWSLPVQCVLPCTHRENWHEAWHPTSGNRIRYRRAFGAFVTEECRDGGWHALDIPPAGDAVSDSPLTCEFCENAPATDLVVVDWGVGRAKTLNCRACADKAPVDAGRVDRKWWRFSFDGVRVAELQGQVDDLTGQVAGRDDTIQRARDRHSPMKIYTECGHDGHGAGEPGVVEVDDVGWVCQDGYLYSICRECCTENGEQTEVCAAYHDHMRTNSPLCPTRKDIDGDPADDGSPR